MTRYNPAAYRDEVEDDRRMDVWDFDRIEAEEKRTAKIGGEWDERGLGRGVVDGSRSG